MKKIKIIILLIILIFIAINLDLILKYIGNKLYPNIIYSNIEIKKPKELSLYSLVEDDKLYLYGIIPQKYDTTNKKFNEKIYSYYLDNNDSLMIYFTKEKISTNKSKHKIILLDEKTNIFKFSKIYKNDILNFKYKQLNIELLNVKALKLYNIYIKDIRIVILIGNINDKIKMNKILLKLFNRLNKNNYKDEK